MSGLRQPYFLSQLPLGRLKARGAIGFNPDSNRRRGGSAELWCIVFASQNQGSRLAPTPQLHTGRTTLDF